MFRKWVAACVVAGATLGAPSPAKAEPITFTSLLVSWLAGEVFAGVINRVTGAPSVGDLKKQLDGLAATDRTNRAAILELKAALDDKMTHAQVEALMAQSLKRVDAKLAEHAERIRKIETEAAIQKGLLQRQGDAIEGLRSGQSSIERQLGKQGDDIASLDRRLGKQGDDIASLKTDRSAHEMRIRRLEANDAEKTRLIREHAERLKALEERAAGVAGRAFAALTDGHYSQSLTLFREAIEGDPTDPGHHYGAALAFRRLGRDDDARTELRLGLKLEADRPPSKWLRLSMDRLDNADRTWLNDRRNVSAK